MTSEGLIVVVSEVDKNLKAKTTTLTFLDMENGIDFVKNSGSTIISVQKTVLVGKYLINN